MKNMEPSREIDKTYGETNRQTDRQAGKDTTRFSKETFRNSLFLSPPYLLKYLETNYRPFRHDSTEIFPEISPDILL